MANTSYISPRALWLCMLILLSMPAWSVNRERSPLSLWLTEQPVSQLKQMLAEHPRFAGQRVVVKAGNNNGLTDALATVLQVNLHKVADVAADTSPLATNGAGQPASVDSLVCHAATSDYQLRVSAELAGYRQASVTLQLMDSHGSSIVEQWRWHGGLSRAEREYIKAGRDTPLANGQLSSPWQQAQIAEAAAALSRDFVCGLRPWIQQQTTLAWPAHSAHINTTLADTLRTSQHYIAAYHELALVPGAGQFVIETRAVPMSGGIWQLWITGRPRAAGLPTIEVATYLLGPPPHQQAAQPTAKTASITAAPSYLAPAERAAYQPTAPRDALRIDILGISKQVKPRRADLILRLRLSNTASRGLEYALRTSGGYFADCRGSSGNYHHDAWGTTSGSLSAGESRVTSIRIENVLHQPSPRRGQSACAGFGDLGAFSNYLNHGDRVTQYLRWDD